MRRLDTAIDAVMWTGGLWALSSAVLDSMAEGVVFTFCWWVLLAAFVWMTEVKL